MNFHPEAVAKETGDALAVLAPMPHLRQFYLAGGTGLALYLGHRLSNDLDFFIPLKFNEQTVIQELGDKGTFQLEAKSTQTVLGTFNGVKVSFMRYGYPLLAPPKKVAGVVLADLVDIACMKIDALSSRGTKRDFIDVYYIAQNYMPLREILKNFQKKYAAIHYNLIHVQKSLVYFADAENDAPPQMLVPLNWTEVKAFFEKEVGELKVA